MKKYIVITSIFNPTSAVKAFARKPEYNLIVIGDHKSPNDWNCDNVNYLSLELQKKLPFRLEKALPLNHYSRKMIGYLIAMKDAGVIIDTDDDNVPKQNWQFPDPATFYKTLEGTGFVNIYQWYTKQKIWPRGLPLDLINKRFENQYGEEISGEKVGIWQGLADDDPDVDAIYRLTINEPCIFQNETRIVLKRGLISPFNSQNTLFYPKMFPLMYLPISVTFRFTDILRGLVAQPIMWALGYHLGFTEATVVQKRNEHDLMSDFCSEFPMYQNCSKIINLVSATISSNQSLVDNLFNSYDKLASHGIVDSSEVASVGLWINDCYSQTKDI